jgi:hypothetical protein
MVRPAHHEALYARSRLHIASGRLEKAKNELRMQYGRAA